jgi:hypothetical protein
MDSLGCEGLAGWHGEPGEVQQWGARRDDAGHPAPGEASIAGSCSL